MKQPKGSSTEVTSKSSRNLPSMINYISLRKPSKLPLKQVSENNHIVQYFTEVCIHVYLNGLRN